MNWAEAVIVIVIVTAIARTLRTAIITRGNARHVVFDHKGNPTEMRSMADGPSAEEAALRREVEELRERVKVLERIATEDRQSRNLADEIEKLR